MSDPRQELITQIADAIEAAEALGAYRYEEFAEAAFEAMVQAWGPPF